MEKHQAGYKLYMSGLTQEEIGEVLKVSRVTVSNWSRKHGWVKKKTERALYEETNQEIVMELVNYQLKTLRQMKNNYEDREAPKLIDKGEIDSFVKMYSALKKKDFQWSDMVKVIRQFLSYLQEQDLEVAKKTAPYADMFVNEKRKIM